MLALSDVSMAGSASSGGTGMLESPARIQSYFQILVKPQLKGRARDEKELLAIATASDCLRAGKLDRVGDLLAGRFMAVETAALEGSWSTARYLEVCRQNLLLAARKHLKLVDRASGKGSFNAPSKPSWGGASYNYGSWDDGDGQGTGRGKGKTKKGKGRDRGKKGKGGWQQQPHQDQRKNEDQPPGKAEG